MASPEEGGGYATVGPGGSGVRMTTTRSSHSGGNFPSFYVPFMVVKAQSDYSS